MFRFSVCVVISILLSACASTKESTISQTEVALYEIKYKKNDYQGLTKLYEKSSNDWNEKQLLTFSNSYLTLNKPNNADKVLKRYVELGFEQNSTFASLKGRILYKKNSFEYARHYLILSLEGSEEINIDDYFILSKIYVQKKEYEQAKYYLTLFIDNSFTDDVKYAENNLAWLFYLDGDITEALERYKVLINKYPDSNRIRNNYIKVKEHKESSESRSTSVERNFWIQIASFKSRSLASRLRTGFLNDDDFDGLDVTLDNQVNNHEVWHVVSVKYFSSKENASQFAATHLSGFHPIIRSLNQ